MCDLVETDDGDFYCYTCGEHVDEPCDWTEEEGDPLSYQDLKHSEYDK